jgi:hypothetical protein
MLLTFLKLPSTTIAHVESDDVLNNAQEAAVLLMNYPGTKSRKKIVL